MAVENFIHLIWKYGLFGGKPLRTTCGQKLEIYDPGQENFHAGPDFFNARLRLGQMIWAGNVEIHNRASDWNRHGHHLDPVYDNVILHVVHHFDLGIKNSRGRSVPALVINPDTLPVSMLKDQIIITNRLPCQSHLGDLTAPVLNKYYHLLYRERLDQKIHRITQVLNRYPDDREKALLIVMASGFGLPVNSLPFEMMASGLPLSLLLEIKDCLPDVEALLFGQSGLLDPHVNQGGYAATLWQRYTHMKNTLISKPLPPYIWKFLRVRPAAFPTIRLSQFASLIHTYFPLYGKLTVAESIMDMTQSLQLESSNYWNTHYTFEKPSQFSVKRMGKQSILNLSINVILPFLAAIHHIDHGNYIRINYIKFLYKLKPEANHVIEKWRIFGINPANALESQALIQLYNGYCKQKRCQDCQIGRMKRSSTP